MKLTKKLNRLFLFGVLGTGIMLTSASCSKDDDPVTPTDNTITGKVSGDASLSLLKTAVVRANLASTLQGTGPFTVFAPTDAAFTAAGLTSAAINGTDPALLSKVLLYHTLPARILAADVPAGPNAKVLTANSPADSVFVTKNANGVFINGIQVTAADISASNGVIHKIGTVLQPASGNIVATAQAAGLDSLVKAVLRATNGPGGNPALASTLSTAILTVFAPTNQAFTNLLTALGVSDINDIPVGTLLAVLSYHVVGGRAFSSDLNNGPLTMLAGGSTTISLSGSPSIRGNGNGGTASNITATNIVCTNGVVHLIDRVLLP